MGNISCGLWRLLSPVELHVSCSLLELGGGREGGDLVARSLGDFAILCKIPLYIFGVSQVKNGLLHIFSKYLGEPSLDIIAVNQRVGVGFKAFSTIKHGSYSPAE